MTAVNIGASAIPEIQGMVKEPNPGGAGGVNCRLPNGWVVTVRGNEGDPQFLVFVGFRGTIKSIHDIIEVEDRRQDDKLFLSPRELLNLLQTAASFDNTGRIPHLSRT